MKNLDEKIRRFEKKWLKPKVDADVEPSAGASSHIGYQLLIATGFFAFIGYLIDRQFTTLPLFTLLLFFIGFATGVYNAWRVMNGMGDQVGLRKNGEKDSKNGPENGA